MVTPERTPWFTKWSAASFGMLIFFCVALLAYVYVLGGMPQSSLSDVEKLPQYDESAQETQVDEPQADGQATEPPTEDSESPAPPLVFESLLDQNDETFAKAPNHKGIVIVYVGQSIREESTKWSDYMYENLPDGVLNAKILDLNGKSKMLKGMMRTTINLQKKHDDMKVWFDWESLGAETYGVPADKGNIICLDENDRILHIHTGPFDEAIAADMVALYDDSQ